MKILLLITTIVFFMAGCKKNDTPINIKLKNKPLPVIKEAIQGKWQLHYAYGGWTGHYRKNFTNSFITFGENDTIFWMDSTWRRVDTVIQWKRIQDFVDHSDSTFLMSFYDTYGYPYSWIVDGIYRDTLLLVDYGPDGMGYYLTRKK